MSEFADRVAYLQTVEARLDRERATAKEQALINGKVESKLGAHDEALGNVHQELETLKNRLQVQIESIDASLLRIRGALNGR